MNDLRPRLKLRTGTNYRVRDLRDHRIAHWYDPNEMIHVVNRAYKSGKTCDWCQAGGSTQNPIMAINLSVVPEWSTGIRFCERVVACELRRAFL